MSADQQSVDRPPSSDDAAPSERTAATHSRAAVELEFQSPTRSSRSADADSSVESIAVPRHYRLERLSLLARIAVLERELEASEKRNQAIVDQYERLLEEQDSSTSDSSGTARSALERLLARFR